MMSRIFCLVVSLIRSFSWPATPATFDVTDSRTDEVMEVARERNDDTDFDGEVGADVILDFDVNGSDLGGSVLDEITFASDTGVADVGLPAATFETVDRMEDATLDVMLAEAALEGSTFPDVSSSFSPERSPWENRLFRKDVVVEKRWLKLVNEILTALPGLFFPGTI